MKRKQTGKWPGRAAWATPVWRVSRGHALHRGFSLVELMIVVAIIAIVAAIALPTYQMYTAKSQIARAFWEASSYKIPVEERLNSGVNVFPDPADSLGYIRSSMTATANTFVFNADGSGSIGVMLDGDVHPAVRGTRITVGRLSDGTWNCSVRGGSDDFDPLFLPVTCALDRGS